MKGYYSTKDLCARFRCSSRTIFRRMDRVENPFPAPRIRQSGACNLWAIDDVHEWEIREYERTAMMTKNIFSRELQWTLHLEATQ